MCISLKLCIFLHWISIPHYEHTFHSWWLPSSRGCRQSPWQRGGGHRTHSYPSTTGNPQRSQTGREQHDSMPWEECKVCAVNTILHTVEDYWDFKRQTVLWEWDLESPHHSSFSAFHVFWTCGQPISQRRWADRSEERMDICITITCSIYGLVPHRPLMQVNQESIFS